MSNSITGACLVPFQWVHLISPTLIRQEPVVVAAVCSVNFGATYHFLQLHRGNPTIGQVPLFAVPNPPNGGTTILDATHLGLTGIASDNMWVALSQSMGTYVAVTAPNGSAQLMIR